MSQVSPPPPPSGAAPTGPAFVPVVPPRYSVTLRSTRPGLMTAVGVLGVVVAGIGIVGHSIHGLTALVVFEQAQTRNNTASSTVYGPPPGAAIAQTQPAGPGTGTAAGTDALPPESRAAIVAAVEKLHRLAPKRREQLDHLLAQIGPRAGFTLDGDGLPRNIYADVRNSGQMPSPTPDGAPVDFLVVPGGRIELYDEGATFAPAGGGGGGPPVRTVLGTRGTLPVGGGANPAVSSALAAAETQTVLKNLEATAPGVLNAAQKQALTSLLQSPGQSIVTPGTVGQPGGWTYAYAAPDGTTTVYLQSGTVTLGPQGQITAQGPMGMMGTASPTRLNAPAVGLVAFTSILSVALAVYLLVVGILVLRQSPRGRRLLYLFAALKIPLAIAAGIGFAWMWSTVGQDDPGPWGGAADPDAAQTIKVWGGVLAVLGCIYPVALLVALRTRAVKDYYNDVRG